MAKFVKHIKHIYENDYADPNHTLRKTQKLAQLGLSTPDGFVITRDSYSEFIKINTFFPKISGLLLTVHYERPDSLMQVSNHIKKLIRDGIIPDEVFKQIEEEYKKYRGFFKKPELIVGEKHKAHDINSILKQLKEIWAEQFEPKNLLKNRHFPFLWITNHEPVLIQAVIKSKNSGILQTNNPDYDSISNLSSAETESLKKTVNKIKKHFFLPQEISWVIDKNKVYVVDLKPMTNVHRAYLVLIRHGRSEYNELGLWAGWDEPPLTKNGEKDVREAARTLKDIHLDIAYASHLIRHRQTLEILKDELKRDDLPIIINDAILERNYGDLTRKNKWEIKKQYGDEQFMKWRRGWDVPIPNGESLKDVYDRVTPYYENEILPKLKSGKNVIVASSGNCLRALVKYLDQLSDADIPNLEIATGEIYVYQINEDGAVVGKEIRNRHENKV